MPRALPATLLPLALVAVLATGCGGGDKKSDTSTAAPATSTANTAAAAPATGGPISVSETEYKITPAAIVAKAGKVTFNVRNEGAIPHEFVVVKTDKQAADLLKGSKADETGSVGELSEQQLGVKSSASLTLDLKAGHYALICNLPGHYQGGMRADFTVK